MGTGRRPLFGSLTDVIAFVITVVVGIGVGYLCSAAEILDDKLKARRHHPAKQSDQGR